MTERQDRLTALLIEYLSGATLLLEENLSEAFLEVQRVLEPFYQITETGKYPLVPLEQATARQDEIIKVLQGVFGESEVTGITFFSLPHPYDKPPWISEEVYLASCGAILSDCLWDRFEASLWDSTLTIDDPWAELMENLSASFRDSFLGDSLWASLWDSLKVNLRSSLESSLFFYLGFAIDGDQERTFALRSLVELLPHFIPLGTKKDDSTTWIVVCG